MFRKVNVLLQETYNRNVTIKGVLYKAKADTMKDEDSNAVDLNVSYDQNVSYDMTQQKKL